MRRGTLVLILFLLIVAIVVGLSYFLRSQPAIEIIIPVSPLAEAWVRDAAASFNASNPTVRGTQAVRVTIQPLDEAEIALGESSRWTETNHADGWIPAAGFAVDYARAQGLPLDVLTPSVAQTSLVWGGFTSAAADATNDGAEAFDWPAVRTAIEEQPVRIAFRDPASTIDGFAVLLSGAAAWAESTAFDAATLRDPEARAWLEATLQAVPNTATLGASAAQAMAARGPSIGGLALLPESEWLNNLRGQLVGADPVVLAYPEYTVVFTFPCAVWNDPTTQDASASDRRAAVTSFCNYLQTPAQQANAARFGLRPVGGVLDPETAPALFTDAVQYGLLLDAPLPFVVEAPRRSDAQLLALAASQLGR